MKNGSYSHKYYQNHWVRLLYPTKSKFNIHFNGNELHLSFDPVAQKFVTIVTYGFKSQQIY